MKLKYICTSQGKQTLFAILEQDENLTKDYLRNKRQIGKNIIYSINNPAIEGDLEYALKVCLRGENKKLDNFIHIKTWNSEKEAQEVVNTVHSVLKEFGETGYFNPTPKEINIEEEGLVRQV